MDNIGNVRLTRDRIGPADYINVTFKKLHFVFLPKNGNLFNECRKSNFRETRQKLCRDCFLWYLHLSCSQGMTFFLDTPYIQHLNTFHWTAVIFITKKSFDYCKIKQ